jgi:hypothetical protein
LSLGDRGSGGLPLLLRGFWSLDSRKPQSACNVIPRRVLVEGMVGLFRGSSQMDGSFSCWLPGQI